MPQLENWLKYLDIVSQRVRHHHDALWEEEKHYSWWIYPILAGTVWLLVSGQLHATPWLRTLIVAGACSIGIYLSWAGFMTVRREQKYFRSWLAFQNRIEEALRDEEKLLEPFPKYDPDATIKATSGISIVQIFKANFLVTGITFVVILTINAYNFWWHIIGGLLFLH